MKDLKIPVQGQHVVFKNHLDDERNERVIFSGIFGIGKTYFLHDFFSIHKSEYLAINLAPVNYSVSSNEDIFQLIKYDILYELIMTHHLALIVERINWKVAYGVALSEKIGSLFDGFLKFLPLLNKEVPDVTPFYSFLGKVMPEFNEIEKLRNDPNLNIRALDFVKQTGKSFLLESDFITKFIENGLNQLSERSENKKNQKKVLVIDDLDRIDPEHIFRLFNIFSAHLNHNKTNSNKFGFDKIIFVCDIDNISNIFAKKYGTDVDFSGYIDKFYSSEIFYFDNREEIAKIVNQLIKSFEFGQYKKYYSETLFNDIGSGILYFLIYEFIISGSLNVRRIESVFNRSFNSKERSLPFLYLSQEIKNRNLLAVILFEILIWVFGNADALDKAFQRLIKYKRSKNHRETAIYHQEKYYARLFIAVLHFRDNRYSYLPDNNGDPVVYRIKILKLDSSTTTIEYSLQLNANSHFQHYEAKITKI